MGSFRELQLPGDTFGDIEVEVFSINIKLGMEQVTR